MGTAFHPESPGGRVRTFLVERGLTLSDDDIDLLFKVLSRSGYVAAGPAEQAMKNQLRGMANRMLSEADEFRLMPNQE